MYLVYVNDFLSHPREFICIIYTGKARRKIYETFKLYEKLFRIISIVKENMLNLPFSLEVDDPESPLSSI